MRVSLAFGCLPGSPLSRAIGEVEAALFANKKLVPSPVVFESSAQERSDNLGDCVRELLMNRQFSGGQQLAPNSGQGRKSFHFGARFWRRLIAVYRKNWRLRLLDQVEESSAIFDKVKTTGHEAH